MLRVFKLQSPMSVGAWTLVAFSSASAAAAFADLAGRVLGDGTPLALVRSASDALAAATGLVMASYTGVLIGATAIPVWSHNVRLLPFHFAASAVGTAASTLELAGHRGAALNWLATAAALVETAVGFSIEPEDDPRLDPLKHGNSGDLVRVGGILSGPLPLALRLLGGGSTTARRLAAVSAIAGSAITRLGWLRPGGRRRANHAYNPAPAAMWFSRCVAAATVLLCVLIGLLPRSSRAQESSTGSLFSADVRYLGSSACQRCHQDQYASWQRALHLKMTRGAAKAEVLGDFRTGTRFAKYGRSYQMFTRDGRYFMTVRRRDAGPETFEANYTLGARRFQGYLSSLPDGRIYVLPAFWHVETAQWVDFKEITPLPDDDHDFRQIWNVNCFNCHATNLAQNFNRRTRTYATTWTEMGIGCEACHGPGGDHVSLMNRWEKEPGSRPAYDTSRGNHGLGALLKVFSPRTAERRRIFDACGYCHGNKTNYFPGFKPGDVYEDYALPFLISQPIPRDDPQGDFWPDGRPTRFNRPQALTASGCFMKGQAVCTDCHLAHGARNDHALKLPFERSNGLCTQCHAALAEPAALGEHTRHGPDSPGSRCVECHMSDVNWRLLNRRRDHTFAPPVPELTARYGTPNPCTTCHDARTPEWATRTMDAWFGEHDRARRRASIAVADAMYRAGSGDRSAVEPLARILANRSLGSLVRASAAEFIGRLSAGARAPSLDALNALATATSDAEPVVRAFATRSLAQSGDQRAVPILSVRLRDRARVVRVLAASGLLDLGMTALPAGAQAAFVAAQDEYAQSLLSFPDSAPNQMALGVLRARQGRYDAAIVEWEQGRRLDPSDGRFAKLIAAAKQRR